MRGQKTPALLLTLNRRPHTGTVRPNQVKGPHRMLNRRSYMENQAPLTEPCHILSRTLQWLIHLQLRPQIEVNISWFRTWIRKTYTDLQWWWVWAGIHPGLHAPQDHGRAGRCEYHSSVPLSAGAGWGSNCPASPRPTESRRRSESSGRDSSPTPEIKVMRLKANKTGQLRIYWDLRSPDVFIKFHLLLVSNVWKKSAERSAEMSSFPIFSSHSEYTFYQILVYSKFHQ